MAFNAPLIDYSGTITVGGTSQTAVAANRGRQYLLIHNHLESAEDLFINFGAAASLTAAGSIGLEPGGALVYEGDFCPGDDVRVNATTTGHVFTIKAS